MQVTKSDRGTIIASEHIAHVQTIALGFWVRSGTLYEREHEQGVSHFLEHMFFKGSHNRSARQIVEAIDAIGGELNAYTTKEYTCYYVKVLMEHLELAVSVLCDMLSYPKFAQEDVEKEKQIVLEEIALYEDTPDELIHDCLASTIWPNHSLGLPVLGSKSSILSLDRPKCLDFYSRHYHHKNMVVTAAGNLNHEHLCELVAKYLALHSDLEVSSCESIEIQYEQRTRLVSKQTEQLHLSLGFPGLSWQHEDIYALALLNNVLGGGMSSRLFQKVREDMGLVYSIYSYSASFVDNGYFGIYAGLSPKNTTQLLAAVAAELSALKSHAIDDAELSRAREQVKGSIVMGLENTASRMSRMGRGLLLMGRVIPIGEVIKKIEAVTPEHIMRLSSLLLSPGHSSLCALGPTAHLPNLGDTLHSSF